jgi:O-antigen/teichoic acid export membrane protein
MSLGATALKGVGWTTLDKWLGRVIGTLVLAVLARLLKPDDFGLVALAMSFAKFAEVVANQGLGFAIVMRPTATHRDLNSAFWANAACFGVAALVLFGTALVMILFRPSQTELGKVLAGLSLSFVFTSLGRVQASILTRELRFKSLAIRNVLATAAGGVTGVALAYSGAGVMSIVGQQIANSLVGLVTLWLACTWRPTLEFSWEGFKDIYAYGYKIFLDRIVIYARDNIDIFLVGWIAGLAGLGVYSIAMRVVDLLNSLFINSLTAVIYPTFSQAQHDLKRLINVLHKSVRLTALVVIPLYFGVAVLAREAIQIVAGNGWEAAVPMVQILAIAYAVSWLDPFVGGILHVRQLSGVVVIIHGIGAITSALAVMVGGIWGIMGVVVAVAVRRGVGTFAMLKLTQKHVPEYSAAQTLRDVWIPLVAALIMSAAALAAISLFAPLWARVLAGTATGVITYVIAYLAINRLLGMDGSQEIRALYAQFRRKGTSAPPENAENSA